MNNVIKFKHTHNTKTKYKPINFVKGNNPNFKLSQLRLKQKIMKTSHRPSLSYCNDFRDK